MSWSRSTAARGCQMRLRRTVVEELTAHNTLAAHLRAEYGVHQEELTTPWHAALASAVSFTAGFLLPLASMLLCPAGLADPGHGRRGAGRAAR